ncbi:unnamed protein product [Hyaloperonospora brassicae]|uniref:Trichohyalin-plectin-homology domain-containing protein n=1 Tax=Hyaloperonospora brassicae TaxID=162125 RepID=A0AAV0TPC7_HYABA|nr:unnamed protein product [Hyaloperonospora brassicae]
MHLRAVAEAQETQQAEHRAAIQAAHGQLQQVERYLLSEAELQRQQRDALAAQLEAQGRKIAQFQARLQSEREALALQNEQQTRAAQEREQSLFRHKQDLLHEKNRQREREIELNEQVRAAGEAHRAREMALAEQERRVKEEQQTRESRLGEEAGRVNLDQANAGRAWQHAQHNAADVEHRVREAEKRG